METESTKLNQIYQRLEQALTASKELGLECRPRMHAANFTLQTEIIDLSDEEEKRKLAETIRARAIEFANEQCSQNPVCPNAKFLEVGITAPEEVNGKLVWDLQVFFQCI